MLTAAKDAMTSQAAKAYANKFISRYGVVTALKIDSRNNRIELVCQLTGEIDPIGVTIEKYRIEDEGAKKFLRVMESSATRAWLQAVLRDHLHGRQLEVPGWAASAL